MGRFVLRLAAVVALAAALAVPAFASPRAADEGWTIDAFTSDIRIQADASLLITERIDVDFGALQKHGIFRSVPVRYRYDDTRDRTYALRVTSVQDGRGGTWPYQSATEGANQVVKIGDAGRTVSGKQSYVIAYSLQGALNPFADRDELYWNVNGFDWPVPARVVTATVSLPKDGIRSVACFQGRQGSTTPCHSTSAGRMAAFTTAGALNSGENLTVGVAMEKGVVAPPPLYLQARPREIDQWFEATPATLGGSLFVLLAGLALAGSQWYAKGRDRVYLKDHYLTNDLSEDARPLFGAPTIVPEYEPPAKLRPAEVGLVLDERADPKDVTATIVDLARRGFLTITENPKQGLFGHVDWTLSRGTGTGDLKEYERTIYDGLFASGTDVKASSLKGTFYKTLHEAQRQLYRESASAGWFRGDPQSARVRWAVIGVLVVVAGLALALAAGMAIGAGLLGVAVAIVGLVVAGGSPAMAARSAMGSDLLRHLLGFRMYMLTAEVERAKFAEREGIFSEYLPYAIVFGCVERWARAFAGIDIAKETAGWYVGGPLNAVAFSSSLSGFSTSISTAVASTPGGSGGSFGGGSSGGGGGGGGGGSW